MGRVVAAEASGSTGVIFIRDSETVRRMDVPFRPFILLSTPQLLQDFEGDYDMKELEGGEILKFQASFSDTDTFDSAVKHLKRTAGTAPGSPFSPYRLFNDFGQQLMISAGFRLFREMNFREIRRMQVDIETVISEGYDFPNPDRDGDRISLISLSDNTGWEHSILLGAPWTEKQLLEEFVSVVVERDPDVIEGHNIFRFDLPYIQTRAKRHKVKLSLGRDGSQISSRSSRISIAERTISYTRSDIYGRHIVDTYFLVQFYDVIHRDLEEYGLKAVARHFGVRSESRTDIQGDEISDIFAKDPERLKKYGLDDVRETRAISEILSPSFFYQTQLVPYSYQNCILRGNATRIDSTLVAEYLSRNSSISNPEPDRAFAGGLTEAYESGIFKNVWHCDVRSLYPSIILAEKWSPSRDYLGIFPLLLSKLRDFRLKAKDAHKKAADNDEKEFFGSLQSTFKILINSFYGYLGFSQGSFNDYRMAEAVTARGRGILNRMIDVLQEQGAKIIEVDTDGIYFQPPEGRNNTDEMEKIIQTSLPEGIDVELDETFTSMFCYKSKNYALLRENGEVSVTGAALKSRGLEPFQREIMAKIIHCLLKDGHDEISKIINQFRRDISDRSLPLAKLAKTETLQDSLETYRKKMESGKGRRSAAYELALKSGRNYRQGDQVSLYVTGNKKKVSVVENSKLLKDAPTDSRDENTEYYLAKIDEIEAKFAEFIEKSHGSGNQMTLELF